MSVSVCLSVCPLACLNYRASGFHDTSGRPFVKRFALYAVGPLSCLAVTLVYCGQTVGRIKMKLGMRVGLFPLPSHIVLGGNPVVPPRNGQSPLPIFGPCLLWPNGWMDQEATWYGGRPQPRRHCARWGP